jgi:flagellar biosynthetic protein FliP
MKLLILLTAAPVLALAAPSDSLLGISLLQNKSGTALGVPMQIVLVLTLLTLLPAILMSITPFLRAVVVLHFLRQALGTQTTPSNQVLVGLAMLIALVVMQPVGEQVYHKAWEPLDNGQINASQAWDQASIPIRTFLLKLRAKKTSSSSWIFRIRPRPPIPAMCR